MSRSRRILILFVREPRLGAVKRRLARDIGATAALRFYRENLRRLIRKLGRDPRWETVVAVAPDGAERRRAALARLGLAEGVEVIPQGRGDLGARMARALRRFSPRPAVLIGGDIPGVEPSHVERAFRALAAADLVFAPASDGGFWLVGARGARAPHDLFHDVRWSGPHALADSVRDPGRRRVAIADILDDVDDGAALKRWREKSRGRRGAASLSRA